MAYVERDAQNRIINFSRHQTTGLTEQIAENDPEVVAFLNNGVVRTDTEKQNEARQAIIDAFQNAGPLARATVISNFVDHNAIRVAQGKAKFTPNQYANYLAGLATVDPSTL